MIKKVFSIILSFVLVLCLNSCSFNKDKTNKLDYSNCISQQDKYLYGMCYIVYEGVGNNIDYKKGLQLMSNMGVKSIRHWMHSVWFLSDPSTPIYSRVNEMKEILKEMKKYDFQIIGMNHTVFNDKEPNTYPARDLSDNSFYLKWLADYEESWYNLARLFPEISIWEIGNENNNPGFMPKTGGGTFKLREMANIFTDMLLVGSRGIHRANPDAITVMGGITEYTGLGSGQNASFLEYLYDNIESGDYGSTIYDDFFQCAAWHPYMPGFDADFFVKENNLLYNIILKHEKKHKKVYLTEIGWGQNISVSEENIAEWLEKLYDTVKKRMPYVESIHYFRAFNNVRNNYEAFGLFYDANKFVEDVNPNTSLKVKPGTPKAGAYKYQSIAGGIGSLDLLMDNN